MEVYYGTNFWGHPKGAELMQKIELDKEFTWGDLAGFIPAVYVGKQGIAIDICVRIANEGVQAFWDKWQSSLEKELSDREQEALVRENPLTTDFNIGLSVNGRKLENDFGCGASYSRLIMEEIEKMQKSSIEGQEEADETPSEELQEKMREEPAKNSKEEELMRAYGCDDNASWCFRRHMCSWEEQPSEIKSIDVEFISNHKEYPCEEIHIGMDCNGRKYELISPINGEKYELQVKDIEQNELDQNVFQGLHHGKEMMEYPRKYLALSYEITPEIAENRFRLQDTGKGDQPRKLNKNKSAAVGVIGGADGPTSVFVAGKKQDGQKRIVMSALHFEPIMHTNWEPVFMEKEREDMSLHIKLYEETDS